MFVFNRSSPLINHPKLLTVALARKTKARKKKVEVRLGKKDVKRFPRVLILLGIILAVWVRS